MSLQCREFRRAVSKVRQRSVQEWEKACSGMRTRERQTALGFVWFQSLYVDTPEEGRRLGGLSRASGRISPFSPSEYAAVLGKAGFPPVACRVVQDVQEGLDLRTATLNRSKKDRGEK